MGLGAGVACVSDAACGFKSVSGVFDFTSLVLLRLTDELRLLRRRLRFRLRGCRFSSVTLGEVDVVEVLSVVLSSGLLLKLSVFSTNGVLSRAVLGFWVPLFF